VRVPFDRRTLLKSASVVVLSPVACKDEKTTEEKAAMPPAGASATESATPTTTAAPLAESVLLTLAAVAERILPSDESGPGAREANVGAYLAKTLVDPRMKNLVPLMNRASGFLVRYAQSEKKKTRFTELSDDEKDDVLNRLAENKMRPDGFSGQAFMQVMVALTLEGFLGDPRHGGNRDRVAWKWLGYDDAQGRAAVFGGR
jgi:gluconate 2-dehydrogenase gamma chain